MASSRFWPPPGRGGVKKGPGGGYPPPGGARRRPGPGLGLGPGSQGGRGPGWVKIFSPPPRPPPRGGQGEGVKKTLCAKRLLRDPKTV